MIIENNFKNYVLYDFSYNGFPELRSELFLRKQISNVSLNEKPAKSMHEPLSRRTKQEIRSAQKVGLYMYLVVFDSFVKLCNLNNLQAEIYTCMYTVIQSKYLISIYLQMALQFANDPQLWAKYVFHFNYMWIRNTS